MTGRSLLPLLATVLLIAGPANAETFLTYRCRDGSEFAVAFFRGDRSAHVQLDGKAVALSKRFALGGARYAKGDITLRITKAGTTLKRGGRTTDCSAD